MINVTEIYIEGFGSLIRPLTLTFQKGINIVAGENGAGKTTIFSALYWCLYGKTLKDLNKADIPTKKEYRRRNWSGTTVSIELEVKGVSYTIRRGIKYDNDFHKIDTVLVYKESEMIPAQHRKDTQLYIDNLLGVDSKTFIQSILFGQRMKRFIEASPTEKRELFETIYPMQFIEDAKSKTKIELDKVWEEGQTVLKQVEELQHKGNLLQLEYKHSLELIENFKLNNDTSIKECGLRLGEFIRQYNLIDIEEVPEDYVVNNTLHKLHELVQKRGGLINKSYKHPEEVSRQCSNCGQSLSFSIYNSLQRKRKQEIIKIETEQLKDEKEIQSLDSKISELKSIEQDNEALTQKNREFAIKRASNQLKETQKLTLKNSIEREEKLMYELIDREPPTGKIKEIENSIGENSKKILELNAKYLELSGLHKKLSWWYSVGFSNKGLKGYVINSAMSMLNTFIQKYTSRMGIRVEFFIDIEKTSMPFSTKCYKGDVEMNYNDFSGGEKARIDVSTAFALHDLVSSSKTDFNILIMDEIFEGLDRAGVEQIFDLIRVKSKGKAVYVITHSEYIDSVNTKQILVQKINNNTTIS